MYSIIFILWIVSNVIADRQSNSTNISIDEHSCFYCQTNFCHCSSIPLILNCSSYSFDLSLAENCSESFIWNLVDFSSRNLSYFNSNDLLGLRMQRLVLASNTITTIEMNTFDSLGNILLELDLSNNSLVNISSTWLNSNLIKLEKFNLASNQLESFSSLDDVQLTKLEYLNLSRNVIKHFPSSIHRWMSLTTLDLSFNQLTNIPRFALMGLNNLTWLSFASNRNLTCK